MTLTISGSSRLDSNNVRLLAALPFLMPNQIFHYYSKIYQLPLFQASLDHNPLPSEVIDWRKSIERSDALIITIPEYIHNLPASIKNALEWLTSSGELKDKPVLPITFTPHSPRGDKAMESLCWSLKALDAKIVAKLSLYQNTLIFDDNNQLIQNAESELLTEAILML